MTPLRALVVAGLALATIAAAPLSVAPPPVVTDLATPFVAFWDRTTGLSTVARVAAFKHDIAPGLPAFYAAGRWGGEAKLDAKIATAITDFGPRRDAFAAKAHAFNAELPRHLATFRAAFPEFRLTAPIYLLNSLGELDGGTRDFDGPTTYLLFGIDVMVAVHASDDEAPFFHHELFHVYHAPSFPGCPELWCSLWSEGLAVYVARSLSPHASDAQLLLTQPKNLVADTRAKLGPALADLEESLDSTDDAKIGALFSGGPAIGTLPRRRGYYLGLLVAEEIGRTRDLRTLAHLTPAQVRPLVFAAVHRLREQAA